MVTSIQGNEGTCSPHGQGTICKLPGVCQFKGPIPSGAVARELSTLDSSCESIEFLHPSLDPFSMIQALKQLSYTPHFVRLTAPEGWRSEQVRDFGAEWFHSTLKDVPALELTDLGPGVEAGILAFSKFFAEAKETALITFRMIRVSLKLSHKTREDYFERLVTNLLHHSSSTGLIELTINDSRLGNTGVEAFVHHLIRNRTLRRLNLQNTNRNCTPDFYEQMIQQLSMSYYLTSLYLDVPLQFTAMTGETSSVISARKRKCHRLLTGTLMVNKFLHTHSFFRSHYDVEHDQLDLSNQQITQEHIESGLLRQLNTLYPKTRHLDLSQNLLQALNRAHFAPFRHLEYISIRSNPELRVLSPAIAQIPTLTYFDFAPAECPNIPRYYAQGGLEGLRMYNAVLKNSTETFNRTRALILNSQLELRSKFVSLLTSSITGTPRGSTDTSAKKRKRSFSFHRTSNQNLTDIPGIKITTLCMEREDQSPDDDPIVLNCWEFTSDHIFHTCNHLFCTPRRTLFFVLFRINEPAELLYELNTIQGSAPGATVYAVATLLDKYSKEEIQQYARTLENEIFRWRKRMGAHVPIKFERCPTWKGSEESGGGIFWPLHIDSPKRDECIFAAVRDKLIEEMGETLPTRYIAFKRVTEAFRKMLPPTSPILHGGELLSWAYELGIEKTEVSEVMQLLSDWGDIIYFPDENDMVVVQPERVGDFLHVSFPAHSSDSNEADNVALVDDIERRWIRAKYNPVWFESCWHLLFKLDVCTPIYKQSTNLHHSKVSYEEVKYVLIPHMAPLRPLHSKRSRMKKFIRTSVEQQIGRHFLFDFILPGFTSRLLTRVLTEFQRSEYIIVEHQEIWYDAVILDLAPAQGNFTVRLVVQQKSTPQDKNLFQATIEVQVHILRADITFARRILASTSFVVDNFVRDQYPQLHENHMTAWVVGQFGRHLQPLVTREHCVQEYFVEKCRQVKGIPMEDLIPEVLDPVSIFVKHTDLSTFDPAQVKVLETVGSGKSGTVYKAEYRGELVAWKVFASDVIDEFLIRDFCQEVSVLSKLAHPNIASMKGFILEPNLAIALEFCAGGTLDAALDEHEQAKSFNWRLLVKIALDVARALCYLHHQRPAILHNDLKPDNIMVVDLKISAPYCVKLVDFGFSIASAEGKRKDIQSFGTMFIAIMEIYCSPKHPSARIGVVPTIKHPSKWLSIPEEMERILQQCETKFNAERLELEVSRLWKRILTSYTAEENMRSSLSASGNFQTLFSVLHNANKNVLLRMIDKDLPSIRKSELGALTPHVFSWIDNQDYDTLERFYHIIDVNTGFTSSKNTAIMYCCQNGNHEALQYFLENFPKLDINRTNSNGYSAAHFAADHPAPLCLKLLENHGADIHLASANVPSNEQFFSSSQVISSSIPSLTSTGGMNVLEAAMFAKFMCEIRFRNEDETASTASSFSDTTSSGKQDESSCQDARSVAELEENFDVCMDQLLHARACLTEHSSILQDRLALLRRPLFSFFNRFLGITDPTEATKYFERLNGLLCSINHAELGRVQKMLDTCTSLELKRSQTSSVQLSTHSVDLTCDDVTIKFSTTRSSAVELVQLIQPAFVQINFSEPIAESLSPIQLYIAFANPPDAFVSFSLLAARDLKSGNIVRYLLLRMERRAQANLALSEVRNLNATVNLKHSHFKLGGALAFRQNSGSIRRETPKRDKKKRRKRKGSDSTNEHSEVPFSDV